MRWKRILGITAAIILVLIVAAYIIASSYDYNKFKPRITALAKQYTGRDLTLGGDIELRLSLSPTLVVNDVADSPDFYGNIDEEHDFKTRSILATPLISGEEAVGIIEAINKIGDDGFDKEDAQILAAIADEVALAVKNARLFDYVVDSYCKIRQGLSSCKGCERPLKSWTPCIRHLEEQ